MQKRPQSPSNIPMPIQRDGSSSNIQRSSARVARQLPQAIVPTPKKQSNSNETRIPAPLFAKSILTAADGRTVDISRYDNDNSDNGDSQNTGVVYITENLIRKISNEDNFHRIFELSLKVPKDLNKKIKYIEKLDSLKNLQALSISQNAIEKMERLDKLVNLQILDLSDNLLKKIEGIESLHKLTVLNVEDNLIESIPAFLGKKLKCLKRLKLARNRLQPVYELYKLRGLPDLVEITTEGNPMCSFPYQKQFTTFLLRSLNSLNCEQINEKDRVEADERFKQDELCRLEDELEKSEMKYQKCKEALEKTEKDRLSLEQANLNMEQTNRQARGDIGKLRKDVETKNQLLESKAKELSRACEKQFKLEQELAFYKLDIKFDEFWKFSGYEPQDEDDQYIDEDQSAYIGKARFKPNSMVNERILPSKAQIVNFIKLVKRKDDKADEINKTIMHDLEEALNVDFKEKQIAIHQAEEKLDRLKSECRRLETASGNISDHIDAPPGLAGVEERERMRDKLVELVQQGRAMQATVAELQNKIAERKGLLQEGKEEIESLIEQFNALPKDSPEQDELMDLITAQKKQCHQLDKNIEQLTGLLAEADNDLAENAQAITVLERKLKIGEANVQQEMKQNLEGMIEKLTAHCNDLKQQMQMQEKHRNDLVKERDFLERKVEQLEDDVRRANERIDDADGIRSSLTDKEDALREQVDINEKLRDAYEKLLQKVNKKKRHVGIGSHDVWHDPQIEKLMGQLNDSEGEIEGLKHELERLKKQRDMERKAAEERLEEEQSKLDEAVHAARNAGDFKREAKELEKQLKRLHAEKEAMRERINELEEDLNKEKNESIPLTSLLKHLQALLNDIDSGLVEPVTHIASTSHRDKRLHRAFNDLRDKINDTFMQNEEEKEANEKQLKKLHAKLEQLQDEYGRAQSELSQTRQAATETEQELNDANQQLEQTQNRLRNALNDRSNNEKLIKDELDSLHARLDEFQRSAGQAKHEANELRSKLEEADRKMRAVEQLAKEAELDYENAKEEAEELRRKLRKANDEKNSQAKAAKVEVEKLEELLGEREADKEEVDKSNEQLQEKLKTAAKRMAQAEGKSKQLEQQLDLVQANIADFQKEIDALKRQKRNDEDALKERIGSAKEKFERMQKAFEDEIHRLKNELSGDEKYIANLKEQLKKAKDKFTNQYQGLAEEIAELQAALLNTEAKFQNAEQNNNRLLNNLAAIEDENNALTDRLHSVEKQAATLLENERMMHGKELRDLEDEIDKMKHLILQLQLDYDTKAYEREQNVVSSLSHEIDTLRQKVSASEKEAAGRELDHRKFKQRLSNEISKLQQSVENRSYEERLLHDKNQLKQQNLEDEIASLLNQISNLKGTLGYREMELASLRDLAQPVIAHFRSRINALLEKLQIKEEELNRLRSQLKDMPTHHIKYLHEPRLDNLSNDLDLVKNSIKDLRNNISDLLLSLPYEGGRTQQANVPLRPNMLEKITEGSYAPQQAPMLDQVLSSPIHHHHYGKTDELPLETVISSTADMGNASVHVHHHNHNEKNKKKRKSGKKTVTYDDDGDDGDDNDKFCNIQEHEDMDEQMNILESRLRNSTLTRSKLSSDSPLKLELKHLQAKVEDAITRRHRLRQRQRNKQQTNSLIHIAKEENYGTQ